MACVHVFVGQCGNQLGKTFLDNLVMEATANDGDDEFARRVSSVHFRPSPLQRSAAIKHSSTVVPPLPRCVMIDMEPKVIEGIFRQATTNTGAYCPHMRQCITRDEGSANNWAFGYYHQGNSRKEDIIESLRHESESCGTVGTFHVVHSIAGGTGSGVGCLVADIVREEFPHALLLHTIVWPFSTGEVITQWYNCVMAMSALRDMVDAVFMTYNDDFSHILPMGKKDVSSVNGKEISFDSINNDISRLLVDLHLPHEIYSVPPLLSSSSSSFSSPMLTNKSGQLPYRRAHMGAEQLCLYNPPVINSLRRAGLVDIVESVALDPALKFFSGIAVPSSTCTHMHSNNSNDVLECNVSSWQSVIRDACRKSVEFFPAFIDNNADVINMQKQQRLCLWSLRGPSASSEGITALQDITSSLMDRILLHDGRYRNHAAHVSLFGPTQNIGVRLSTALRRSEELLSAGAFTHHFSRYGVEAEDMRDAIVRLWDTATMYTSFKK